MATTAKKPARKTTKKPTKRTAKASTARKTTAKKAVIEKKASAKNVGVKVSSSRSARRVLTPLERVRSIHITSVFTQVFFAILTLFFMSPAGAELLLSHSARDRFVSQDQVVLAPASEVLFNVEYRYILMAILLLGALGSLLLATRLRAGYEKALIFGASGMRWILFGITSALILEFVSFMAGIQDVMTLKTIAGLVIATTLFSWIADRENVNSRNPKWLAYGAGLFTGFVAFLPLIGSLIGTSLYGEERFGWHVYALAGVILLGFIGYALNQYRSIKKKNALEYTFIEQRYLRIDQILKFVIVLIVFSALAK